MDANLRQGPTLLVCAALVAAIVVGIRLRLEDPLSATGLPAENPYTHLVLVRDHVADGSIDPLHARGALYPPGMHAVLAAAWISTGADLVSVMRFAPVVFGAVGVLGMGLLLLRFAGPVAAVVGSLAYAIAPEIVFRTTMMAPTAVDLAVLPFLFYALLETVRGRLAFAAVLGVLTLFVTFSHPWLLSILLLSLVAFLVVAWTFPWPADRAAPVSRSGFAAVVGIFGGGFALTVSGCLGACGPGFRDVFTGGADLAVLTPVLLSASALAALLLWRGPRFLGRLFARTAADPSTPPPKVPTRASTLLLLGLGAFTLPGLLGGLPAFVDLPGMFGTSILVAGIGGFILAPRIPRPITHIAAGLFLATYPFVIYNPLESAYWPHRTAAYLGVSLAMFTGLFAAALVESVTASREPAPEARGIPRGFLRRTPFVAAAVATLFVAGAVQAGTPEPWPWYRMYTGCEAEALREIAPTFADGEGTPLLVGSWEAKLVLWAFGADPSEIWLGRGFFEDPGERERNRYTHIFLLLEPNVPDGTDPSFLGAAPWKERGRWCVEGGRPTILLYEAN
ncbi:MAG: hypothetical protein ACT4PT_04820 [Methanobacteriota archaeon]